MGAFTHVRACAARQPGPRRPRRPRSLAVWFRLIELARSGHARSLPGNRVSGANTWMGSRPIICHSPTTLFTQSKTYLRIIRSILEKKSHPLPFPSYTRYKSIISSFPDSPQRCRGDGERTHRMRFEYGDDTPVTRRGRAAEGCRNGGLAKEPRWLAVLSLLTCRRGNRYTFLPTTARSTARPPAKCADVWGSALSATSPAASADAEDGTARPPGGVREGRTEQEAAAT